MKRGKINYLGIIIFIFVVVLLSMAIYPVIKEGWQIAKESCEKKNLSNKECNLKNIGCVEDCFKINFNYFKQDLSGFGSNECWCELNNTVVQIW